MMLISAIFESAKSRVMTLLSFQTLYYSIYIIIKTAS